MKKISLRIDTAPVTNAAFVDTVIWAVDTGLLTEDEVTDLIGDEIVSNVKVVEESGS